METTRCFYIICAVVIGLCSTAQCAITNGGFETGDFSGWSSSGTRGVVTNEYSRDFLGIVQPPSGGVWYPTEGNYFASLWSTNSAGTDVSTLSRSFTANTGMVLEFDYFFDYGDYEPYYDWAIGKLSLADSNVNLFEINTSGHELADDENRGWTTFTYSLPVMGTYMLEFSTGDGAIPGSYESILGIDNVSVIPAPGAFLLVGIGIFAVNKMRRKRII